MKRIQAYTISITLLILIGTNLLQAQQYQADGYIIFQNDTIHGKIVHTSNQQSQQECIFITDSIHEIVYTPNQISGWGIGNLMHFRSVSISHKDADHLKFALVLLSGYSSLLRYMDKRGVNRYLLCLPGQACQEINDPGAPRDESKSKGRLIYLLGGDERLRKQIYSQSFSEENLIEYIEWFNEFMSNDKGVRLSKIKEKAKFHFGLKVGYGLSNLSYSASNTHNLGVNYEASATPFIAPFLELAFQNPLEKFSLRLEVNYQSHNYQSKDVRIDISTLRIPFLLIFKPLKTSRNLGLVIGPYIENAVSVEQNGAYFSNPIQNYVLTNEKLIEIPDKPFGFGVNAGIEYLQPISRQVRLLLSLSFAYSWNHTDYRYYAIKSGYKFWTNMMINNQKSFLDFAVGIRL